MKQVIDKDIVFREKCEDNYLEMRFVHESVESYQGIYLYYFQALGIKDVYWAVLSVSKDPQFSKRFRKGKLSKRVECGTYGTIGLEGLVKAKAWLTSVQQGLKRDQVVYITGLDKRRFRIYKHRLCREEGFYFQPAMRMETDTYTHKMEDCVIGIHPEHVWDVLDILTGPNELEMRMKSIRKKKKRYEPVL